MKKDSEFDWWSKFYLSAGDEERSQAEYGQQGFDKLMVSTVCTVVVGVHQCTYCTSRVTVCVCVCVCVCVSVDLLVCEIVGVYRCLEASVCGCVLLASLVCSTYSHLPLLLIVQVYDGNLEDYFGNFEDIATTFPLYRGKGQRDDTDAPGQAVGKFKVRDIVLLSSEAFQATVLPVRKSAGFNLLNAFL